MTDDRVHPSAAKPPRKAPPSAAFNGGSIPRAKTTQLYNPYKRPRPLQPPPNNHNNRRCTCRKICCLCFLYSLITLLSLILLLSIIIILFYFIYHPNPPTFTLSSLTFTTFNLTAGETSDETPAEFYRLNSTIHLTITAKNPNTKHILFNYDPFLITATAGGGVDAGNSTVNGFTHAEGNTTVIRATVVSDPTQDFDKDTAMDLRSGLGKKSGFPMRVEIDTQVKVKMGKVKSKRVGIRVICDGIRGLRPKNSTLKSPTLKMTKGGKCKVVLRIRIWRFTF